MNVLFLDIDGVLNSDAYFAAREEALPDCLSEAAWDIDTEAIRRLNQVVRQTSPTVVLSSDWRKSPDGQGIERTNAALRQRGACFRLADATPELSETQRLERFGVAWRGNFTPRGLEIQYWLDQHPQVGCFAILDDEPQMEHLTDHLVSTRREVGLTDEDCAKLLDLFAGRRLKRSGSYRNC